MIQAARIIGTGIATTVLIGAGVGLKWVFWNLNWAGMNNITLAIITVFMVIILASSLKTGYKKNFFSLQQWELYLLYRMVLITINPISLLFIFLFSTKVLTICSVYAWSNLFDQFLHEIFAINYMMEGNPDNVGGQSTEINANSPTGSSTNVEEGEGKKIWELNLSEEEKENEIKRLRGEIDDLTWEIFILTSKTVPVEYEESRAIDVIVLQHLVEDREDDIKGLQGLETEYQRQKEYVEGLDRERDTQTENSQENPNENDNNNNN